MSEHQLTPQNKNALRKIVGATALVGMFVMPTLALAEQHATEAAKTVATRPEKPAVDAAETVVTPAEAEAMATQLTNDLQQDRRVPATILKGRIVATVESNGLKHMNNLENPILFGLVNPGEKIGPGANALNNLPKCWVGVQGSDAKGNVVITAEQFGGASQDETFTTANPIDFVQEVELYAQPGKGGGDVGQLYAFNKAANQTLPYEIAWATGMK